MLSQRNPALAAKINQLSLPLAPLVSLPAGNIHPLFPSTLLNFWLLTSDQLDELAHFYHQSRFTSLYFWKTEATSELFTIQRTPGPRTLHYPCPIQWKQDATLEEKRRKLGHFIGLRGCESPVIVQSEEMILEEVRRERERRVEEEARAGKGKWY